MNCVNVYLFYVVIKMAEEGGDISEMGRRRSARILALEEEKKRKMKMKMMKKMKAEEVVEHNAGVLLHSQQQVHDQKHQHGLVSRTTAPSTTVKQYGRRRVCKRKRLQDVTATSFAYPSHQVSLFCFFWTKFSSKLCCKNLL